MSLEYDGFDLLIDVFIYLLSENTSLAKSLLRDIISSKISQEIVSSKIFDVYASRELSSEISRYHLERDKEDLNQDLK